MPPPDPAPSTPLSTPAPAPTPPRGSIAPANALPYRIACLCDLRDARGRVLMLRRTQAPNLGLCSPIGGKLDVALGESPAQCAQREIREEAGLDVPLDRIHLLGMVSEQAYEGRGHWLMFVYRVLDPVWVEPHDMREGRLDWFDTADLDALPLPETDRAIIWPLMRRAEHNWTPGHPGRPGFFSVHIDCRGDGMRWTVEQEIPAQQNSAQAAPAAPASLLR